MAMKRNTQRTYAGREASPFSTAEEAWIWYAQCQIARDEGVRFVAGLGAVVRPCSPDDIAREVLRLHRRRILRSAHLRALGRFVGRGDAGGVPADGRDEQLWQEALDRLLTPLRAKGIVE